MYDQNEGLGEAMARSRVEGKADDANRRIAALEKRVEKLESDIRMLTQRSFSKYANP